MNQNPYDTALDPPEQKQVYYGQLLLDLWFCALIKGQGKVPFDPTQHSPRQRLTCVKIDIVPLPETNMRFDVSREFIAEFRKDGWLSVTLPSLRALGVEDLKALHEQYVKAELVNYGTYTKKDGGEGDLSAPKIVAVYASREDCLAAFNADEPEAATASQAEIPIDEPVDIDEINRDLYGTTGSNGTPPVNEAQKRTALAFLPAIVRSCRASNHKSVDIDALATKLAETPLLKDYFTLASPEVVAEVEAALTEPVI